MMRASNPNLDIDYASGIKYIVDFVELQLDRDKRAKTSSQLKCPIPHDVPMLSEISYYQPIQCIRPRVSGPLLRDSNPRESYPRVGYESPAIPIYFQRDLSKAAELRLDKFKGEDARDRKQ
jgi:hypothetical protein